ncbi:MAG: indole-3-glycerol phosphate synthase TrpC [Desulfarculaceae bacterium]|nr:indole-3-glycerol phosphate synthase TrpC [Desulfarculaceae bacterium]
MGMTGFLKEVTEHKKRKVQASAARLPLKDICREAESMQPAADFRAALEKSSREKPGIIAEIKKASPSKGDIRPDLDAAAFAQMYTKGGACAVSVLTEQKYFKGSLEDLEAASKATDLPVLRKDFTIHEYQIHEARFHGASSILLICTLLETNQLSDYIHLSRETGMEPLVEINSEYELETADRCGAVVIGVNNRNLATLETDLNVTRRIAPLFTESHIPVQASGIRSAKDIRDGVNRNIYNFLIGESIVTSDDPQSFIQELLSYE